MKNLSIFASWGGSNAKKILEHFKDSKDIRINHIFANNPNAWVLQHAENFNVDSTVFTKKELNWWYIQDSLSSLWTDYIALAWFLDLIPAQIVEEFRNRILNVHPSLLPKYWWKWMHWLNVHRAVLESWDNISWPSFHLVDEEYDRWEVLFQAITSVRKDDTPETLAKRVLELEHHYFPLVIEELILNIKWWILSNF